MNLDDPVDVNNDMFKDLIDLATTDKIYLGETSDGGLMFRDGLSRYNKKIAAKCVVALGLTEVCCEIGKGKVCQDISFSEAGAEQRLKIFYVSMVEDLSGPVVNELTGNAKKKAIYTFFRLPKLIYVPFIWTEEDRQIWKAMTHAGREFLILIHQQGNPKAKSALADIHNHVDRLLLLNARSGAVPLMQEVLPLDLIFDPEEKVSRSTNVHLEIGTADHVQSAGHSPKPIQRRTRRMQSSSSYHASSVHRMVSSNAAELHSY